MLGLFLLDYYWRLKGGDNMENNKFFELIEKRRAAMEAERQAKIEEAKKKWQEIIAKAKADQQ